MIEIAKEIGLWVALFIGGVVLVARGSQLVLMTIVGDEEFDKYVSSKSYRESGSIFIRFIGITMERSSELMLSIIRAFPLLVGVFSTVIVLWALYAVQNT
jgi:hypothetical protein